MFRFTIRDVLWLTVVVALGVGWWSDRAIALTKLKQPPYIRHVHVDGMVERLGPGDSIRIEQGRHGEVSIQH